MSLLCIHDSPIYHTFQPMSPPATRLEQQIANMNVGGSGASYPFASSEAPPPPGAPGHTYSSSPIQPPWSPQSTSSAPSYPSPPPPLAPSSYQSPPISSFSTNQNHYGSPSGTQSPKMSPQTPPPMPDAVLNMAARGPPEKKPWAYAPDMSSIQQQREKVRKK